MNSVMSASPTLDSNRDCCKKLSVENCFHCGEAIPEFSKIHVQLDDRLMQVCCHGCKAAAEYIIESGLTDFYTRREQIDGVNPISQPKRAGQSWDFLDDQQLAADYVVGNEDGSRTLKLAIPGIYCASCTLLIEQAIAKISDQVIVTLSHQNKTATLELLDPSETFAGYLRVIEQLGYDPSPLKSDVVDDFDRNQLFENRQAMMRIAVSALGMMQVMTYAVATYLGDMQGMDESLRRFLTLVSMLVATGVVCYAGKPFFDNAWNDLKNKRLGMDVPIALAIGGAYLPSVYLTLFNQPGHVYFDSAVMFVFFLTLGRYVETKARHKLNHGPQSMLHLLPKYLEVEREAQGETHSLRIAPDQLQLSDRVKINVDQMVPFDGVVYKGSASVDESMVTGEAMPRAKHIGDKVVAGSVISSGVANVKVQSLWRNSSIARIERLLNHAQTKGAKQDSYFEGVTQYFVQFVLLLTLVVGVAWWWVDASRIFQIVLAMLVASCPCAFALAGPVGNTAASKVLRSKGLLLANFDVLPILSKVNQWCFDKTGTLSEGKPKITSIETYGELSETQCLRLAASLEQHNSHVLSRAFQISDALFDVTEREQLPGSGVRGVINAQKYFLGSPSWISDVTNSTRCENDKSHNSIVELAIANERLARFTIQDKIRASAKATLTELQQQEAKITVLSGDHADAVHQASKELPVDINKAAFLPEQKLAYVKAQQEAGDIVAMLGDGVNDAPVLAQADVGLAMASGSELAHSQADIVLLNGQLSSIAELKPIAQAAMRITRQNMRWAIAYNGLALPLAAFGYLSPWLAALGMSISSALVVLNALRVAKRSNYKISGVV